MRRLAQSCALTARRCGQGLLKLQGTKVYPARCSYISLAKAGQDVKIQDTFDCVVLWGEPQFISAQDEHRATSKAKVLPPPLEERLPPPLPLPKSR